MFKHKYISARIDRHTYLKGRFRGKFSGKLDPSSSDPRHERYYDLEITEGEIETRQDDLVPWMENKEPDEFAGDTVFPTRLPGKINVTLHYLDGETKHFKIALKQIKLKDCHLSGQVYGKNEVQGNIEGLISGYVLHHDMLVKEIVEEAPVPPPLTADSKATKETKHTAKRTVDPENIITADLSPNRTHFLKIIGGLIGLGLIIAALLLVKNRVVLLTCALGSGLFIRWLHYWTGKRYRPGISRSITTVLIILILTGFVFYLPVHYQDYNRKSRSGSIINVAELKNKASQLLTQNDYQDALGVFDQLLSVEANDPGLLYQRAFCHSQVGNIAEAVADLRLLLSKGDTAAIHLHNRINPLKRKQVGTVIRCKDGTISNSKTPRGTCSHHGGVKDWDEPVYQEFREY